jgi:hypothetical protein
MPGVRKLGFSTQAVHAGQSVDKDSTRSGGVNQKYMENYGLSLEQSWGGDYLLKNHSGRAH